MPVPEAGKKIAVTVGSWEGVTDGPHRFGGVEFRVGRREVGHVHGDSLVDIPFSKTVRDELIQAGVAEPHHVLPKSGWVSVHLRNLDDVERAIQLLRKPYEIARQSQIERAPSD